MECRWICWTDSWSFALCLTLALRLSRLSRSELKRRGSAWTLMDCKLWVTSALEQHWGMCTVHENLFPALLIHLDSWIAQWYSARPVFAGFRQDLINDKQDDSWLSHHWPLRLKLWIFSKEQSALEQGYILCVNMCKFCFPNWFLPLGFTVSGM